MWKGILVMFAAVPLAFTATLLANRIGACSVCVALEGVPRSRCRSANEGRAPNRAMMD